MRSEHRGQLLIRPVAGAWEPALPPELEPLLELALDLRWTWSHAGDALWRHIDETAWERTQNPWFILLNARKHRLEHLAQDARFRAELDRLIDERKAYLEGPCACAMDGVVAYFSMEFGLGPGIPLYAGGLGILAGDHLKTASDLGAPIAGVGLLYQEGYFRQTVDAGGRQREAYPYNEPYTLPIQPVLANGGDRLRVPLELPGRLLWLRVWRASVGCVSLYLLDSNDPLNSPVDRGITAKLYGGDNETRFLQEVVLGIGGWRALAAAGVNATVAHMNEGHAAFVVVERARDFAVRQRVSFWDALWATRAANVFTTHTPVAAGFDAFSLDLLHKYYRHYGAQLDKIGAPFEKLAALGQRAGFDPRAPFTMAHLALRGSAWVNGVSAVHGLVSRRLFADLFRRWPEQDIPVESITNGVHVASWDSAAADALWTRACGKDRWLGSTEAVRDAIAKLGDEELWNMRADERRHFVGYVRDRARRHLAERGAEWDTVDAVSRVLDPNALTLGFARRFAEYKRPNLLLRDADRLTRLLCNRERPVQIVLAGKAHPADEYGKQMIAEWMAFVSRAEVRHHAVFLEDYDISLAEHMVQGVDVWINTPRPPWEACGTSGMKVLVNGGLNVSELDGWWVEAFSPEVGWALGGHGEVSDDRAATALYELLEREVVPEFYDRDTTGVPKRWVARIRASMSRLTAAFSSNRMVREYFDRMYRPAMTAFQRRSTDGAALAIELAAWEKALTAGWADIHFSGLDVRRLDNGWQFEVGVYFGEIDAASVRVELYAEASSHEPQVRLPMQRTADLSGATNGHVFSVAVETTRPAGDFTPRVVPYHVEAKTPLELPLILWQR